MGAGSRSCDRCNVDDAKMTNLITITLLSVAANSTVEWSNDLETWQPYACTYVNVPQWVITIKPDEPKQFWRYTRYGPIP